MGSSGQDPWEDDRDKKIKRLREADTIMNNTQYDPEEDNSMDEVDDRETVLTLKSPLSFRLSKETRRLIVLLSQKRDQTQRAVVEAGIRCLANMEGIK